MSDDQIPAQFIKFFKANQHVWQLFQRYTFEVINSGRFKHVSAERVWRRIRWEVTMERGSDEGLKFSNDWRVCCYARLFHIKYPEHDGFLLNPKNPEPFVNVAWPPVNEQSSLDQLRQLLAETEAPKRHGRNG